MKRTVATFRIRKLRGAAQSQLMCCSEGSLWVVKFRNNPQGCRTLVNEFLVTRLAQTIGLDVPDAVVIEVPKGLIESSPEMAISRCGMYEPYSHGLNYACRYAGGLMPGQVLDFLPTEILVSVRNVHQFAGAMALDKWTGNTDHRQAVFNRCGRNKQYDAQFIDHGNCFDGEDWAFRAGPLHGIYRTKAVYENVRGWDSFDPWLDRIETIDANVLQAIVCEIPADWYADDVRALDSLIERLVMRRHCVRNLIADLRDSSFNPFPRWA